MKAAHSELRAILAEKCRHAADRWVAAEVRYFEAVLAGGVDQRPVRKARRRAIGRGDHLADYCPRMMVAGLPHYFVDTVTSASRELANVRAYLAQGEPGTPPAHPLGDPRRQILPERYVA